MDEKGHVQSLVNHPNHGDAKFVLETPAADEPDDPHSTNQPPNGGLNQPMTVDDKYQPMGAENEEPVEVEVNVEIERDLLKAPDGGWGWFVVLGSFVGHVLMGGFERSSGVMYLQLLDKFGMSATETSWVFALFSTLRLCMGPVASMLCNKFSIRVVVYIGAVLSTVGVLLSAFTPNLWFLYFSYGVLTGVGRAMTYCPCLIIVGYYFNKRRGVAVGLATSGVGIGIFLFPPIIENMFGYYGFQGTFIILAGIISNYMICGALFRPLDLHRKILTYERNKAMRKKTTEISDGQKKLGNMVPVSMEMKDQNLVRVQNAVKASTSMEITANTKIMARTFSLFKHKLSQVKLAFKGTESDNKEKKPLLELSLFRNYAFTALCIQYFLFTLSYFATFVFLPAIAKDKGLSQIDGAYLLSILGICDGVSRVVMSIVLDLKKVKRYRLIIYNFLMVLVGVVSVVIPFMETFWQFSIVSVLYGLLSGTYISQKSVVVVDVLGVEKLSSSFGLVLLFQGIGSLIGPIIGALFKDLMGTYDMSFYVGSSGIFLGAVVLATGNIWLHLQKRKKTEIGTAERRYKKI